MDPPPSKKKRLPQKKKLDCQKRKRKMVSVLLSASVEKFSVSRMQDFSYCVAPRHRRRTKKNPACSSLNTSLTLERNGKQWYNHILANFFFFTFSVRRRDHYRFYQNLLIFKPDFFFTNFLVTLFCVFVWSWKGDLLASVPVA